MAQENKRMIQMFGEQAEWDSSTTVPFKGEVVIDRVANDDIRIKVGDGVRLFGDLPYPNINVVGGDGDGSFTFNGRAPVGGNIEPADGDYDADMIDETISRVWYTPAEKTKLAGIDVRLLLPGGGSALQALVRASNNPFDFAWATISSGPGGGASHTYELLDWDATPPTVNGQIPVWSTVDNKYHPQSPAPGGSTRIQKGAAATGTMLGLSRPFVQADENSIQHIELAYGPVKLVFDDTLTHGTSEVITSTFLTLNYDASLDYQLQFLAAVTPTATLPALTQFQFDTKKSTASNTAITTGANIKTVTVAAGADTAIMVLYSASAADIAQPTLTLGCSISVGGAAATTVPWTDQRANRIDGAATRVCSLELKLGTLGGSVVYTFQPIWTVNGTTPVNSANVNSYCMMIFVANGADQLRPFGSQHPDNTGTAALTVTSKVWTGGPGRMIVHNVFKRNNTVNTPITADGGFTTLVEGTTGPESWGGHQRFMAVLGTLTSEGVSVCNFTLPNAQAWAYAPFSIRPSVQTGMTIRLPTGKTAVAASNVIVTVVYDKTTRVVNVSW